MFCMFCVELFKEIFLILFKSDVIYFCCIYWRKFDERGGGMNIGGYVWRDIVWFLEFIGVGVSVIVGIGVGLFVIGGIVGVLIGWVVEDVYNSEFEVVVR